MNENISFKLSSSLQEDFVQDSNIEVTLRNKDSDRTSEIDYSNNKDYISNLNQQENETNNNYFKENLLEQANLTPIKHHNRNISININNISNNDMGYLSNQPSTPISFISNNSIIPKISTPNNFKHNLNENIENNNINSNNFNSTYKNLTYKLNTNEKNKENRKTLDRLNNDYINNPQHDYNAFDIQNKCNFSLEDRINNNSQEKDFIVSHTNNFEINPYSQLLNKKYSANNNISNNFWDINSRLSGNSFNTKRIQSSKHKFNSTNNNLNNNFDTLSNINNTNKNSPAINDNFNTVKNNKVNNAFNNSFATNNENIIDNSINFASNNLNNMSNINNLHSVNTKTNKNYNINSINNNQKELNNTFSLNNTNLTNNVMNNTFTTNINEYPHYTDSERKLKESLTLFYNTSQKIDKSDKLERINTNSNYLLQKLRNSLMKWVKTKENDENDYNKFITQKKIKYLLSHKEKLEFNIKKLRSEITKITTKQIELENYLGDAYSYYNYEDLKEEITGMENLYEVKNNLNIKMVEQCETMKKKLPFIKENCKLKFLFGVKKMEKDNCENEFLNTLNNLKYLITFYKNLKKAS